ncbi:hypothetical protein Q2T40_10840 [Winogradskyella maritima]|uniref:Uncharacterized protein n=1 Tax=Winogradskyella maritima TaxID=1517766 RepID=A0ABV8AK35_9FLAO|nr:hypothetical protein [Winogradskyella maritima]
MKIKYLLPILCLSIVAVSCSGSDDNDGPQEPVEANYYPSEASNTWFYNVENESTTNPEVNFSESDLVTIASSNGGSFTIDVNNDAAPSYGLMNSILNTGTITRGASTLSLNGSLPIPLELDGLTTTDIVLSNFVLYDLNVGNNSQLAATNGVINETVNVDGTDIPLTATYTITNTRRSDLNSLTVDGESFSNVIVTDIVLNLEITATVNVLGNPTTQTLLVAQDVLTIRNYFAQDVGLIKSEADQSYELNQELITLLELGGLTIDFPTELSVSNTQDLDSYSVGN